MASSSSASSLKYPYPVEVNVRDFVDFIPSKKNYFVWKKQMLLLFESEGLVGFINGEVVAPPEKMTVPNDDVNSPNGTKEILNQDYQDWKRSDTLIQRWIIRTIDEDLVAHVVDTKTASDMWTKLETLFTSDGSLAETIIEYPYPVEVNVGDYVPIELSRENYSMWAKLMLRLLQSQGLYDFITGRIPQPRNCEIYKAWKRTDALLQSWIIRTINKDFIAHVVDTKTASHMWTKLKTLCTSETTIVEYPYPVEVNVGDYVPVKLSRENYSMWAKLMLRLLQSQGLDDFIKGRVPQPDRCSEKQNYKAWKRTDGLLQSWILGTISQNDVFACVGALTTASEMWIKLKEVFPVRISKKKRPMPRNREAAERENEKKYRALHIATLRGEWDKAEQLLKHDQDAVRADITGKGDTILMVAVRSQRRNHFVKKLLEFMPPDEDMTVYNDVGQTSLHFAAAAGNLEAAKLLVAKNPRLSILEDDYYHLPLHAAALLGHKNMLSYLLGITNREDIKREKCGASFVVALITRGLYDTALQFVHHYGVFAREETEISVLEAIAMESSAFKSGTKFNIWEKFIYFCAPARLKKSTYHFSGEDIENPPNCCIYGKMKLKLSFWKVAEMIVPWTKHIREKKWKDDEAIRFVKHLCVEYEKLDFPEAQDIIRRSLIGATTFGIHEVVKEIISVFPEAIYYCNEEGQNLFHIAILNRHKNVFKLVYQLSDKPIMHALFSTPDSSRNFCLDMVACLKCEQNNKLKVDAAGAALQMQLELQWFKEVEKISSRYESKWQIGRKTPWMIFSETHRDLMKEGEKWLKDTANSCTIVAALVVTIVFAAAITVPGGNHDNNGIPIFSKERAFFIFIISDAVALFSSASSLLMFLSILTSRYAEIDFLLTLPNRLIFGLITLLISIVSMMVAFGATLYLVFGQDKTWILGPVSVFSTITVILFATWQIPLLWDMINSTYGDGIFGKHNDDLVISRSSR